MSALKIQNLPDELKDEYRRIFDSIDIDHSGSISITELQRALKLSERQCAELLKIGDTNADGELDWEEFFDLIMSADISFGKTGVVMTPRTDKAAENLRFVCMLEERRQSVALHRAKSRDIKAESQATTRRANRRASLGLEVLQEYIELFNSLDKDGNGHVDQAELAEGLSISLEQSSYLLAKGDRDSNHMLDLTEFIDLMTDETTNLDDPNPQLLPEHLQEPQPVPESDAPIQQPSGGVVPCIDLSEAEVNRRHRTKIAHHAEYVQSDASLISESDLDWLQGQMSPGGTSRSRTSTVPSSRIGTTRRPRSASVASVASIPESASIDSSLAASPPTLPTKIPSPVLRNRGLSGLPPLSPKPRGRSASVSVPAPSPPARQRSGSVDVNEGRLTSIPVFATRASSNRPRQSGMQAPAAGRARSTSPSLPRPPAKRSSPSPATSPALGVRQVRRGSMPEPKQVKRAAVGEEDRGIEVEPATFRAPCVGKEQLPAPILQEFKHVFQSVDVDGNGTVSMEELSTCLGIDPAVARAIVHAGDRDGDRELNFDEFIEVMSDPRTQLDSQAHKIEMLGQPFQTKSGNSLMLILQGSSFKQDGPLELED